MRGPMIITDAQKIFDEGIISGRAKERKEFQHQTAKKMLLTGLPDEVIINCSGISPERLEKLKVGITKSEQN